MKNLENKQLIILMAGKGSRLYPLTFGFPKCLLSVKQKPAIYNMLVPLIKQGLKDITIVVNLENRKLLADFFNNSFSNLDLTINYIIQDEANGPAGALKLTKDYIVKPTILLLGDTLCSYPKNYDYSWIGIKDVCEDEKSKYCMIDTDKENNITDIIDKPNEEIDTNKAAIGIYYFKNYKLLKEVLDMPISKKLGEYQLSSYFKLYKKKEILKSEAINDWQDIGTLNGYMETNRKSFNCRNFNSLYLDEYGVIYKKSDYNGINSEMKWFGSIEGTGFEKLVPKIYKNGNSTEYGIEYYDYLTLSEYITYYPLSDYSKKEMFNAVLKTLLKIYKRNIVYKNNFDNLFKKMLIDKTYQRINEWNRKDLLNMETLVINNKEYKGLFSSLNKLLPYIEQICSDTRNYTTVIHGDVAFTNILFSPRTLNFKLIDARGNFGVDTIYGDYRYDLAKLRHCYHGRYDEIVNDLFEIKEDGKISFKFYRSIDYTLYDNLMENNGIDINDIELIEALLFISMIPLHNDYPDRQLAFFCQGITLLNHQIEERLFINKKDISQTNLMLV